MSDGRRYKREAMGREVAIIDYGTGNVASVAQALERLGARVELAARPSEVMSADSLVLPGVGAFGDGMRVLKERGLDDALMEYSLTGRPLLGICLGMQLLFESGEEFGSTKGLGLLPGKVAAIPREGEGRARKVPHVGWSAVTPPNGQDWTGSILDGVLPGESVYFVHSYTAVPDMDSCRIAECDYDGCVVTAAIQEGPLVGCQFHPEKSGKTGLRIMRNFLKM